MIPTAIPRTSRNLQRNKAQEIKKISRVQEEKELKTDALQSPRTKNFARKTNQGKTGSPRTEKLPVPADQDKNLAPHNKIDEKGAIKSAPDVAGDAKILQKQRLNTLKTWAKNYPATEKCSAATKKTFNKIVRAVEKALKDGQTAVDLTSHAAEISALRSIRQKALRNALKEFNITGLPEAQKKTVTPRLPVAKNESDTGLEKTAPPPC